MPPPPLPDGVDPLALLEMEQDRLERFLAGLDAAGWEVPTACVGWRRREMVAHLAGDEVYNRACLDDALASLFSEAGAAGVSDVDGFNAWQVRLREERSAGEVLDEWRNAAADVRTRLRDRAPQGTIPTMVGPYAVGAQAFHLAFEAAIHGDDMDIPVAAAEAGPRRAWMAAFCGWSLAEEGRPVEVTGDDGGVRVRSTDDGAEARLDDAALVAHFAGRRPDPSLPESLARALRMYGG
jgi:uncharacterized protein (TIGR03083 family)